MRFGNLYVRTALLASLILAVCACQSAQKPVALMPPATAPSLKPTPAPSLASKPAQTPTPAQQPEEAPAQKPAIEETAEQAAPISDPVADLIARAENEYQAGLVNYHNGKVDEARQNFDQALNALLSSNVDVRSDDRLEKEFDRIVQGVNELYPGGTAAMPRLRKTRSRNPNRRRSTKPTASRLPPTPASKPRPRPRSRTRTPTCR